MRKKKKTSKSQPAQFNYLFFGIYFLVIATIHIFHVFIIEPSSLASTTFFVAYALIECVLETLGLMISGMLLIKYFPKMKYLFAFGVFFLFLAHIIDFPLVRMMDMTFWHAFYFVSQLSYANFIELLLASNVSLFIWLLAGLMALSLIFSGIFLYHVTEKWSKKRERNFSTPFLCTILGVLVLFLSSWDLSLKNYVQEAHFDLFQKTLPWKSVFFPPKTEFLSLKAPLPMARSEAPLMASLDPKAFAPPRKPDVYLFIIESLRADFINAENTPNLARFKEKNVSFDLSLSNANATHISWFSLFHSQFPFYWASRSPREVKAGSVPLQILKKMGYKIHVFSSARLSYFQMNRLIFGEGDHLADTQFISEDMDCSEPCERDHKAIEGLLAKMKEEGSGRLFIVFLDATHLDYSWPREMSKFFPFEENINYIATAISKSKLEKIKNRYRNALFYTDYQMGNFFQALDSTPKGRESVVMICGDHGEEFYEHGHLFHASSLTEPQIRIPLYYRFGENKNLPPTAAMTCQMDVFPSIFHYIHGKDLMGEVLQGESIFKESRWPYAVIARFNAINSPYEFCIHSGSHKLLATFQNRRNIFESKRLKILSTKNSEDETISAKESGIYEKFGPALERIFPSSVQ